MVVKFDSKIYEQTRIAGVWVLRDMAFNVSDAYLRILASFYMLVEGFAGSIVYYGSLPLFFYYYRVSVIEYQKALIIALLPWSCRAGVGIVSDMYPIRGWHKRWYAQAAAGLLPLFLAGVVAARTVTEAIVCFAFVSTFIMVVNTLFEGQYAHKIKFDHATNGLAAFTKGLAMVGSIGGVIVVGVLADSEEDAYRIKYGYAMCIALAVPLLVYLARYPEEVFSGDRVVSSDSKHELLSEERNARRIARKRAKPSTEECRLAGVLVGSAVLVLGLMFNISTGNIYTSFAIAGLLSTVMLGYTAWIFRDNKTLMGICIFSFSHEVFYVDVSAAMDVFYTAPAPCLIGPDFDLMFYIGWTRIIGHTIAVIVIVVFTKWFQHWNCRHVVIVGISFRIYSSVTDIIIGKRWNVEAGISDKSCYVLGDAMISPAASMFVQLALILATTSALTKGKETLTQSIVASLQALGQSVSRIVGITLIYTMNVTGDLKTGVCNYDNYVPLLIVAHVIVPCFLFPLAFTVLR